MWADFKMASNKERGSFTSQFRCFMEWNGQIMISDILAAVVVGEGSWSLCWKHLGIHSKLKKLKTSSLDLPWAPHGVTGGWKTWLGNGDEWGRNDLDVSIVTWHWRSRWDWLSRIWRTSVAGSGGRCSALCVWQNKKLRLKSLVIWRYWTIWFHTWSTVMSDMLNWACGWGGLELMLIVVWSLHHVSIVVSG